MLHSVPRDAMFDFDTSELEGVNVFHIVDHIDKAFAVKHEGKDLYDIILLNNSGDREVGPQLNLVQTKTWLCAYVSAFIEPQPISEPVEENPYTEAAPVNTGQLNLF